MKELKISLEILYNLFNNKIELGLKSKADLRADQIIEENKKYFNHIGVAWHSFKILYVKNDKIIVFIKLIKSNTQY